MQGHKLGYQDIKLSLLGLTETINAPKSLVANPTVSKKLLEHYAWLRQPFLVFDLMQGKKRLGPRKMDAHKSG